MKIGILTLHRVRNYGSVLQAHALCKILKDHGHTPIVIDYIPERFRLRSDLFFVREDRYKNNGKTNYFKKYLFMILSIMPRLYYYTRFTPFVKKYIPTTQGKYFTNNDLLAETFDFDIYMNGSDQVWNMAWENSVDKAFFLDFVPKGKKKLAYAASFGKKVLSEDERSIMAPLLRQYNMITVRESSAVGLLERMGIGNAIHVLDPTLLCDKTYWAKLVDKRIIKKPYLAIYQLNYRTCALDYARKIADTLGLEVVDMSRKFKASEGVDCNKAFVKPEVFLNIMYYADYIVTDSFHGTAFSVNFNKNFISIKNDFPERAGSLLALTGLADRFVENGVALDEKLILDKIDYKKVNEILARERLNAEKIIQKIGEIND